MWVIFETQVIFITLPVNVFYPPPSKEGCIGIFMMRLGYIPRIMFSKIGIKKKILGDNHC